MDLLNKIDIDPELQAIVDKIAANRVSRKRERKAKHESDESFIQCNAGVKLTKKAAKSIIEDEDDNTSMYVMTYIDGDKEHTDVFKQCSAKCKEDNDYCGRHQKRFDDNPIKIVDFRDPDNYSGYALSSSSDDFFKAKPRAKRGGKKKSTIEAEELSDLIAMMELIRGDPELMRKLKEKKEGSTSPSPTSSPVEESDSD